MHTNYIIPVNFTDAGKLLGTFPVRSSIEALCLLVPVALTEENAALLNCARSDLLDGEGMYAAISQVLSQAGNPS